MSPRARTEILIVDNDDRIVELVAWFLKKRGYGVRAAKSFAEARPAIEARWPDLMLSDIDLGVESAMEELPRLAAAGSLPPTLVVSGYLDAGIEEQLKLVPAVLGTLAKPFDFPVLEARIVECLGRTGVPTRRLPDRSALGSTGAAEDGPEEDGEGWIEITPPPPRTLRAAERAERE